jgi:NAD(P)-dependent dehydrogenase (short-subunit alcohol dehydrogenase family)
MTGDSWTHENVPDQSGRTVVVTGANSGLGYEATKAFARNGAHVVMACRSLNRARSAREEVRAVVTEASIEVMELDLADLASVRSFVDAFERNHSAVHVLCNNAGVMAIPRRETADGFEMQFGVNHLGHFALTGLLLDRLDATSGETRVVTQSSGLHERGDVDFDDLQHEEYDRWAAYAQSKLSNLLFAYELDRRLRAANANVTSVACHPGYAATNLQRRGPEMEGSTLRLWALRIANVVLAQSPKQGVLPMLYASTASHVDGGEYVGPGGLMGMRGAPETQRSSDVSYDADRAQRLWQISADLTGVAFDLPPPET